MAGDTLYSDRTLKNGPNISQEDQDKILEMAADGEPIQTICKIVKISWHSIARYCLRDPLFEAEWKKSRSIGADALADSLSGIYDGAETVADAMIARGKSDNIRTLAGWRNPNRYGPKLNVEVQHTIDLSKALQQAESRVLPILEQAKLQGYDLSKLPECSMFRQDPVVLAERSAIREVAKDRARHDIIVDVDLPPIPTPANPKSVDLGHELSKAAVDSEEFESFL